MQFQGYQINNLKSYRQYFCFADAAAALRNGAYREWLCQIIPALEKRGEAGQEDLRLLEEIRRLLDTGEKIPEEPGGEKGAAGEQNTDETQNTDGENNVDSRNVSVPKQTSVRAYLLDGLAGRGSYEKTAAEALRKKYGKPDGCAGDGTFFCPDPAAGYVRQIRLLLLVHALARVCVTDLPAFLACLEGMTERNAGPVSDAGTQKSGITVFVTGPTWLLRRHPDPFGGLKPDCPAAGDGEDLRPAAGAARFIWKKLQNDTTAPVTLLLAEQDITAEARHLHPGCGVWYLERDGCFVKWGGRIQVDGASFACADRQGRLIVNGFAMKGGGLADFSFDETDGILGVDPRGRLKQYSRLAPAPEDGEEAVLAYLHGGQYWLLGPDGGVVTSMERTPSAWLSSWRKMPFAAALPPDFPFAVSSVCVSSQLLGFETMDGRAGVWDLGQCKLIWMEE